MAPFPRPARALAATLALASAGVAPRAYARPAEPPPPPPPIAVIGLVPLGAADPQRAEIEDAVADALRAFTKVHASSGVRDVLAADPRLHAALDKGKAALAAGIAAFKRVDSAKAVARLRDAETVLGTAHAEIYDLAALEETYLYLGAALVLEADGAGANVAFKKLLRLDPAPVLPKGFFAPDVVKVLDAARVALAGTAPELPDRDTVEAILHAVDAEAVAVTSRERTGAIERVVVYLLRPGADPAKGWATLEAGADPIAAAGEAARRAAKALGLHPLAPGLAASGGPAADAADPALAGAPARRTPSVFARWWFWTGAGVLVAGGVTAVLLILLLPRAGP